MSSTTREFVRTLESLKAGDLGRLRSYAGCSMEQSVEGFDLFTGIWWPLREKNQSAPRREVAWLVAKLGGRREPGWEAWHSRSARWATG